MYSDTGVCTLTYEPRPSPSSSNHPETQPPNTYIDWSKNPEPPRPLLKWTTLIVSSLLVGYLATLIDFVSVWLNDLKKGLCFSQTSSWSLSNPYLTCPRGSWNDWSMVFFGTHGWISSLLVNMPIYLLFAVAMTILAAKITAISPRIKHSGIPEVKLIISGFNYYLDEYLGIKTLLYKIAGLVLVVSSGLWLGKEGPLVHVSCCLLNVVYSYMVGSGTESVRRELLTAATATGISVAFNAPIGGVLFVLEMMPTFFMPTKTMWNSFVSATFAVVVMSGFRLFTEGENFTEQELFHVPFGNFSWLFLETVPFVALGLAGGFYGHALTRLHLRFTHARKDLHKRVSPYIEIVVVVVITTLLNFPVDMAKLPLNAYLKLLFTECADSASSDSTSSATYLCSSSSPLVSLKLAYIFVQGFILSAYTYGLDLPGGILMPSLVLGASFGRLVGILSQGLQSMVNWDSFATCTETSCLVSPSSYAVVGAASFMAGVTKLTMSVVVIIFELTGAVTYVLPIMFGVMTSKLFNDWLCNDNIYDSWLKAVFNTDYDPHINFDIDADDLDTPLCNAGKGHGLVDFSRMTAQVKNRLPDVPLASIMVPLSHTKCICLSKVYSVAELLAFMTDPHEGYPVVESYENPLIAGYVYKMDLYEIVASQNDRSAKVVVRDREESHTDQPESCVVLRISFEQQDIIMSENTPIVSVFGMFEQLHLNYALVVREDDNRMMAGWVDRFGVSRVVDSGFGGLDWSEREMVHVEGDGLVT